MANTIQNMGAPAQNFHQFPEGTIKDITRDLFSSDAARIREIISETTEIPVVRAIIHEICQDQDHTDDEKGNIVQQLYRTISFQAAMGLEVSEESDDFLFLLLYVEDREIRQEIIANIVEKMSDDPYLKLIHMITVLQETDKLTVDQRPQKNKELFDSFPEHYRSEFIDRLYDEADMDELGEFFTMVEEEELADELIIKFLDRYREDDDFSEDFCELITDYAKTQEKNEREENFFLKKLFSFGEDQSWIEDEIINHLNEYSTRSIAYVMKELDSEMRKKIYFELEDDDDVDVFDKIMKKVFRITPSQEDRIQILSDIFADLDDESLDSSLSALGETESTATPYLYLALEDAAFSYFITVNADHYSKITRHLPDLPPEIIHDIARRLHESTRASQMLENAYLDITPQEWSPVLQNYTMQTMFQLIRGMLERENPQQALDDYQEDLQRIPEFLLAIAVQNEEYREPALKMMRYLSDSQITTIASVLPKEVLGKSLDSLSHTILEDQFGYFLNHLPRENLTDYIEKKTEKSVELVARMEGRYQYCEVQLCQLQSQKDELDPESYSQMYEGAEQAYREYLRASQELQYQVWRTLHRFLEPLEEELPAVLDLRSNIQSSQESVTVLSLKRKEHGGILELLDELEIDSSEEDDNLISDEYWSLLVTSYLPHFELGNAGELTNRGIQSDRDFELLGLSHENRTAIDRLCQRINCLTDETGGTQIELNEKWDDLLKEAIIDMTGIQDKRRELIRLFMFDLDDRTLANMHEILTIISSLSFISPQDLASTQDLLQNEASIRTIQERHLFCRKALKLGIHIVVSYNFHVKLKEYLTQPNIEPIWEFLRIMEVHSLEQLRASDFITTKEQCFELQPVAELLGFEPWEEREGEIESDSDAEESSDYPMNIDDISMDTPSDSYDADDEVTQ